MVALLLLFLLPPPLLILLLLVEGLMVLNLADVIHWFKFNAAMLISGLHPLDVRH